MVLFPLQKLSEQASRIALVASDVDGTLTHHEKFIPELFHAIAQLHHANIPLLLVTGRSAGWVDALRYYLPVAGAIAENGGVYFPSSGLSRFLSGISDVKTHRQKLADTFEALKKQYSNLCEASDNAFRLTDWTFDVQGLSAEVISAIAAQCNEWGWGFTYSTVQCHILPVQQSKALGIQQVLHQYFPDITGEQILTLGDSPNDESMFNPDIFPVSVGVANLLNYRDQMKHLPQYVTAEEGVLGFCELADLLCQPR